MPSWAFPNANGQQQPAPYKPPAGYWTPSSAWDQVKSSPVGAASPEPPKMQPLGGSFYGSNTGLAGILSGIAKQATDNAVGQYQMGPVSTPAMRAAQSPAAPGVPDYIGEIRNKSNEVIGRMEQDMARFQPGTAEYDNALASKQADRTRALRGAAYGMEGFFGNNAVKTAAAANAQRDYQYGVMADRTMLEQQAYDRRQQGNSAILNALGLAQGYANNAVMNPLAQESAALDNLFKQESFDTRLDALVTSGQIGREQLGSMRRQAAMEEQTAGPELKAKIAQLKAITSEAALKQWEAENAAWLGALRGTFELAKVGIMAAGNAVSGGGGSVTTAPAAPSYSGYGYSA